MSQKSKKQKAKSLSTRQLGTLLYLDQTQFTLLSGMAPRMTNVTTKPNIAGKEGASLKSPKKCVQKVKKQKKEEIAKRKELQPVPGKPTNIQRGLTIRELFEEPFITAVLGKNKWNAKEKIGVASVLRNRTSLVLTDMGPNGRHWTMFIATVRSLVASDAKVIYIVSFYEQTYLLTFLIAQFKEAIR